MQSKWIADHGIQMNRVVRGGLSVYPTIFRGLLELGGAHTPIRID